MIKKIPINLLSVKDDKDLILTINSVFCFEFIGITFDGHVNWNSFIDSFRSLDTESRTFKNFLDKDKVTGIHLILKNYKSLNRLNPKDKQIFEEILEEMTHKENRYDDLEFTYEVIN